MSTSTMIFVTGFFVLMFFGRTKSASNRRCLPVYDGGSFCFTQPDPPVALSWPDAMQWCRSINATLPITDTNYHTGVYQNALGYFGLQTETLWLGANFTYHPNNWLWTDGRPFTGTIILGTNATLETNVYVKSNGSVLTFFAASPFVRMGYVCGIDYSELTCASSYNSFWANGRCFYKYGPNFYDYSSYYYFRSRCQQSKIPSYDDLKELKQLLANRQRFWIAVRSGLWEWQNLVTGRSYEVIGSYIGTDGNLPSVAYGQCLASTQTTYSSFDCIRNQQFVCFEHVNATLFETTTYESTSTTLSTSDTTTTKKTTIINKATTADHRSSKAYNRGFTSDESNYYQGSYIDYRHSDYALAVGLGVGGGVLLLTVISCLAILALRAFRKNRSAHYSPVDLRRQWEYYHQRTTAKNAFENFTINVASEALRNGTRHPYKPINPAANEYVY